MLMCILFSCLSIHTTGRLPRQELFSYYNSNLVKSQFILVVCR